MREQKCPKCYGEVPKQATKCKNCGSKLPKHVSKLTVILCVGLLGIWIITSLVTQLENDANSNNLNKEEVGHHLQAYTCAKMRIEKMIKSPRSAKFESVSYRDATIHVGEDRYIVTSSVDSQNSFGVMLHNEFICDVQYIKSSDGCQSECQLEESYTQDFLERTMSAIVNKQ